MNSSASARPTNDSTDSGLDGATVKEYAFPVDPPLSGSTSLHQLTASCNCPESCILHFSQAQRIALLQRWGNLEGLRLCSSAGFSNSPLCIATVPPMFPATPPRFAFSKATESGPPPTTPPVQSSAIIRRRVVENMATDFEVVSAFSEEAATLASRGWSAKSLAYATPWLPPQFEIRDVATAADAWSGPRVVHIVARLLYSRATIRLERNDLEPSHEFLAAVKSALPQETANNQFDQIQQILERWGHVIPLEFQIGGVAYATTRVNVSSLAELLEKEEELKTKLSTELMTTGTPNEALLRVPVSRIGGDLVNSVDHAEWLESLKVSTHWQIIKVKAAMSTLQLLDDASFKGVQGLAPTPLYHFPSRLCINAGGYIESPLDSQFNPDSEYSISAFFFWPGEGHARWSSIFSLKVTSHPKNVLWIGLGAGSRKIQAEVTYTSERLVRFEAGLTDIQENVWTHVTLSHKVGPTGRVLVVYVNGRKDQTIQLVEPMITQGKMWLMLGCGFWGGRPDFHAVGSQVAGVKVFGRALTKTLRLVEASSSPECLSS